jgi:hypothetical protein
MCVGEGRVGAVGRGAEGNEILLRAFYRLPGSVSTRSAMRFLSGQGGVTIVPFLCAFVSFAVVERALRLPSSLCASPRPGVYLWWWPPVARHGGDSRPAHDFILGRQKAVRVQHGFCSCFFYICVLYIPWPLICTTCLPAS